MEEHIEWGLCCIQVHKIENLYILIIFIQFDTFKKNVLSSAGRIQWN